MGEQVAVLFVCMGNICRSPSAEGVMRKMIADFCAETGADLDLIMDSAGTHAYHVGETPDERAVVAARQRGVDISTLRARAVTEDDFLRFDYIMAMDRANLASLKSLQPAGSRAQVDMFLDYCDGRKGEDVPDPYYGGETGFERVLDLLEEASLALLKSLHGR